MAFVVTLVFAQLCAVLANGANAVHTAAGADNASLPHHSDPDRDARTHTHDYLMVDLILSVTALAVVLFFLGAPCLWPQRPHAVLVQVDNEGATKPKLPSMRNLNNGA